MEDLQCMENHEHHICAMAENHMIEHIKELTTEPQYICVNCGRVSNSDENLCKPVHVDSIGLM
jgi:hypothetical protein